MNCAAGPKEKCLLWRLAAFSLFPKKVDLPGVTSENTTIFNLFNSTGTYPLDVVRRRMQMKGATGELFKYNSTWHAFNVIVKTEGIHGLFKGMWPNLLKVTTTLLQLFSSFISWSSFH